MPHFRIVPALLALAALAGCATSSAHAGRETRTQHPVTAPVAQAPESEEAPAQPSSPEPSRKTPAAPVTKSHRKSPEPEPAVAAPAELGSAQAEFFCGASGALERRAPMERPAGVVSFESGMTRPEKLAGPPPFYTQEALDQNIQGQVLARCILTREGTVRSCRILKPLPIMDEEVLLSLCSSRYTPVLDGGQPVDVEYTFNVRLTPP